MLALLTSNCPSPLDASNKYLLGKWEEGENDGVGEGEREDDWVDGR